MKIIEKIEIKHFRSFDGGKDQVKVKIDNLSDLNVFSGANDSGKSNVLRALNLFFNGEISPGITFDKNRDFSKIVSTRLDEDIDRRKKEQKKGVKGKDEKPKELRRSDEFISVKLHFNNKRKQRGLPEKFWVTKLYSQKNSFQGEYIYQPDHKGNAQVTRFLSTFQFEYVPAIKDKSYFNHLFEKLQTYLFEKEDKRHNNKFAESSKRFNDMLQNETLELFKEFQNSSGVDASFYIPSTLVDFFRTLSVRTENDISLFDRGDGVQARFIPVILNELSRDSKKNIIWGFEEPENSYESRNIQKIRDEFIEKYSRSMQIFITSHTKEFLSVERKYTADEKNILNNPKLDSKTKKENAFSKLNSNQSSSGISIYRVWKNDSTKNTSFITRYDEINGVWEDICDDLGIVKDSRIIEALQDKLTLQEKYLKESKLDSKKQKNILNKLRKELHGAIDDLDSVKLEIEEYKKPILIVEDKYDAIYKIAYLKLNNISTSEDSYDADFSKHCSFAIRRAEGAGAVSGKLKMNNTDGYEEKKIAGLFDFDNEGAENFYHLKNSNNWAKPILGDKGSCFYKKRKDHPCFYGMLLPVPDRHLDLVGDIQGGKFDSKVEVENLLSDAVLLENKLVTEEKIFTLDYLKVKGNTKGKLANLLLGLDASEFQDFIPLFEKIAYFFD